MRYVVSGEFTKISETTGTIQNMSNVYAVEVSNKAEADSGIILYPLNRISVTLSECYLRCVDGGNAEVRVVPFEVDVTRGGGSSAAGTSNLTDVFRSLEVIDGKVNFYGTTDKSDDILASFNLPEEIFLNQVGTIVVHDFMFSALAYPNSINPNLDGKTVLVLAVKGDKKTNPTIKYVFVDLQKLVDKYLASNKSININGYSIAVNISDDTKNLLALKEDGLFVGSDDSKLDKVPSAVQDNIPVFDVEGTIIDGGLSFADLEYELPTASVTTKGGVKVGSGLAITGDTLSVTIQPETYTLPTASTTQKGGVIIGDGLQMDGDTLNVTLQSGSSGGSIGILDTVPSTVDGGFWYEMFNDKPVLKMRKGDYNYVFENSRIQRVTASEYLVAWLRFNQSTTYDECGIHTWEAVGSPTIGSTNSSNGHALQLDTDSYVQCTDGITLGGRDFTIDCWFYCTLETFSHNGIFFLGVASGDTSTRTELVVRSQTELGWANPNWSYFFGTRFAELSDPVNAYTNGYQVVGDTTNLTSYDSTVAAQVQFTHKLLHLAFVYSHSRRRFYVFLHGVCVKSDTTNFYEAARTYNCVRIGRGNDGNGVFTGAISEFRIHDGVALWTENFTPPTAEDYL